MSLSLSSLLNPSPDSETRAPSSPPKNSIPPLQQVQSPEEYQAQTSGATPSNYQYTIASSTQQEAAQALAKLSASPVAPPTQWNGHSAQDANQLEGQRSWDRRSSGYGDPITLPPPVSAGSSRKMSSPTLEQYQVASRSPEQRRASIIPPQESNVTLPPLQGFASQATDTPSSQAPRNEQPVLETSPTSTHDGAPSSQVPKAQALDNSPALHVKPQTSNTTALADDSASSPAVIKRETVPTPQPSSPTEARRPSDVDVYTTRTVASLKNEHSLRTQSPLRESSIPLPSTETASMEAPAANPKKRPAPSKKKGTASTVKKEKAPPAKKRKVEPKRSATPSSRASKPPTIKGNSTQGTPANSSPAPSNRSYSAEPNEDPYDDEDEEMDDDGDDGDVYCLCRKPDNGTFMIGCDGTCDDWFHGKCVGIEERDKNLIDKYMCPNCTKKGIGQTTWKRMCRRGGCRQPAKVGKTKNGTSGSKYCSDECGVLYFRDMAARTRGREESAKNRASRRKSSTSDLDKPMMEDELGARGGALSAGEVKALLNVSKTAEEFKKLGDGVPSPPATPDGQDQEKKSQFTESETQALQRIQIEKEEARRRHAVLKDRMKFVTLVKQAASRMATEKELKPKEYCGYDSRLEWTGQRFQAWRNSKAGQQAFELDTLQTEKSSEKETDLPDDQDEVNICDRKKCARHLDWSKLTVDDIRFEMSDNSDRMRALDKEEREMKVRATLRAQAGKDMNGEGTVEVHGLGISAEPAPTTDKMNIDPAPQVTPSIAATVEKV